MLTECLVQWSGSLLKATLHQKEHLMKDGNILIIPAYTYLVGRGQKCCLPSYSAQERLHDKESSDPNCQYCRDWESLLLEEGATQEKAPIVNRAAYVSTLQVLLLDTMQKETRRMQRDLQTPSQSNNKVYLQIQNMYEGF